MFAQSWAGGNAFNKACFFLLRRPPLNYVNGNYFDLNKPAAWLAMRDVSGTPRQTIG